MAHRFRFFVEGARSAGEVVDLAPGDVQHLRVLRLRDGAPVEVVDGSGQVFDADVVAGRRAHLHRLVDALRSDLPEIVLYAGVLPGQRWDALVDGAVQAGASVIVPVVQSSREQAQVERRAARATRVAEAAAKQAKRVRLPRVAAPIRLRDLPGGARGIVLDERATRPLVDLDVGACVLPPEGTDDGASTLSLLVGPAAGLPVEASDELQDGGWTAASLGPTILRSELAAAVAVACALQLLDAPPR
jgi:16S rRNA (uracil1498-N3)-methyltransferase